MKRLIKQIISGAAALALVAGMMPGMSMEAKAVSQHQGEVTATDHATGSASYAAPNMTVTLTAAAGYEWASGPTVTAGTGTKVDGTAAGDEATITGSPATAIPSADKKTAEATFTVADTATTVDTKFTFTIGADATAITHNIVAATGVTGGEINITAASVTTGGTASFTTTPDSGYRYAGATVSPGGVTVTAPATSFTVPAVDDETLTVTPIFKEVHSVTAEPASPAGTVVAAPTTAIEGDTITLSIDSTTIPDGYKFKRWKVTPSTTVTGDETGGTFTMPDEDVTVTAILSKKGSSNVSSITVEDEETTDGEDSETTDGEDSETTNGEDGKTTDGEDGGTGDGEDGKTTDGEDGGDAASENPFTDVVKSGDNDPYYDAIVWAAKNNVVKGKSDTSYDPNGTATRVEFTTMMHRLLKDIVPGNPGTTSKFADCQNLIEDFTNAILWAESLEPAIIQGVDANNFAPNAPITRAQVVTLIWRAAGSPEPKSTTTAFTDLTADYYKKAVAWGVEQGIVKGTSATTFAPDQPVTRAQLATFLYRAVVEAKVFGGQ